MTSHCAVCGAPRIVGDLSLGRFERLGCSLDDSHDPENPDGEFA